MSLKDYIKELENKPNTYYIDQLKSLLPIDKYGIQFMFNSNKGKTKWMDLNEDSIKALKEFFDILDNEKSIGNQLNKQYVGSI